MNVSTPLKTLSDRISYAMEITGTRKADLARALNISPQSIQFLCNSKAQSSKFSFEIATALGLNIKWLVMGEGEIFLSDDPVYKLFKGYKQIPILNNEQLILKAKNHVLNFDFQTNWAVLKTNKENIFSIKMPDISMEPHISMGSLIFFDDNQASKQYLKSKDIVVAFISKFNAIVIREIIFDKSNAILYSKNSALFSSIPLNEETKILGIAIEFHNKVKREE